MGAVKGAISIKDNMTAVLRGIKQEQSAFRQDVASTRKELQSTWDKKRTARLEATAAAKSMDSLKKKLEPLRKKVVTAVAIKDMATAKLVATPVVKVAVKGAQALSAVGKGIAEVGKMAAVGVGAVAAAGAAGLAALFSGSTDAAKAQIEAETKLEAVLGNVKSLQAQGAGAVKQAKQELMGVAGSLQQVGVIGDEVTLAGMQQLATFQLSNKEISTLAGGMTDLLAQQKGLNAAQEDSVTIANMIGKAMNGQVGALSRVGISFTDAQAEALKMADSEGRAAILAEILQQNVGGVNKALAETDQGKIQQMNNAWGDMKEEVGKVALSIKSRFASVVMKNIPTVQKLGTTLMGTITKFADFAMPVLDKVLTHAVPVVDGVLSRISSLADSLAPVLADVFGGLGRGAQSVRPLLEGVVKGFVPLLPQLAQFGSSVLGTVQTVAASVMPAVAGIVGTVQSVIPAVLPVLQTVISTVGSVISQAAPVIAGMVQGIGTVVTTLAPVFQTIFDGIGQKVGSVIGFVSGKMGFIQEVIGTVAPAISSVLTTAWKVISPVMDIAVSAFKLIFNVVQAVFPGIQKVVQTVWNIIKPIVEGIGGVLSKIGSGIGWLAEKLGGGSGKGVGANAGGTNNWRGGPTWVGERGPELVDLPRGSRVLPNKESVQVARSAAQPVIRQVVQNTVERPVVYSGSGSPPSTDRIEQYLDAITGLLARNGDMGAAAPSGRGKDGKADAPVQRIEVHIAKLADAITVREEADIGKIGEAVAKEVVLAAKNMTPV